MATTDNALGVLIAGIIAKQVATAAITTAMKGPWTHSKPSRFATEESYVIIIPGISVDSGWTCSRQYWLHEPEFRFYEKTPDLTNANLDLWLQTFGVESLSLSLSVGGLIMHRVTRIGRVELEPKSVEYASATMRFRTWMPRSPLP